MRVTLSAFPLLLPLRVSLLSQRDQHRAICRSLLASCLALGDKQTGLLVCRELMTFLQQIDLEEYNELIGLILPGLIKVHVLLFTLP